MNIFFQSIKKILIDFVFFFFEKRTINHLHELIYRFIRGKKNKSKPSKI